MGSKIVGIDIGATKIHIGLVQDSTVVRELKFSTTAGGSKEEIMSTLVQKIEEISEPGIEGIGIGVPGLVDSKKGIIYDLENIPSWKEVHLKDYLEDHFQKPVKITNDANVFVMGEKIFGKGRPYENLVGITLGSGFGTGIIIDHKLYSGAFSSAGELGNIPYRDKTIEEYCSGKFFRDIHGTTGNEVYNLALKNDEGALKIFQEFGEHLGEALKLILYVLSPQAILLGGSVSNSFRFFEEPLVETVSSFPFKKVRDQLKIMHSNIPNISILGSAALILSEEKSPKF
ncbi:ROK family protein [Antarcticibacterium sp. 1MA-6-2]|uniref:ROK family protein n=1 Tax=Antarcticibacterium sp. 1MA-6-2 TaxID=2908210 RepID=UPI001F23E77E|nr:ROK family protein [Antarcticibacterium sp. 1MA-6-2]UJH90151.1 ROK family protein [Antarcticibacterium sp. 1MA-6-2]